MHGIDSLGVRHDLHVSFQEPGNNQARKLTAAIAMPTPNNTPARTRFEPPSPKAKVRPDTTMATRESPRAIVLVNACCKTFTAFSHGELPVVCAKAGAASIRPKIRLRNWRASRENDMVRRRNRFMAMGSRRKL